MFVKEEIILPVEANNISINCNNNATGGINDISLYFDGENDNPDSLAIISTSLLSPALSLSCISMISAANDILICTNWSLNSIVSA